MFIILRNMTKMCFMNSLKFSDGFIFLQVILTSFNVFVLILRQF